MKFFIHLGYPNTAQTNFKRNFYSEYSKINYLGIENDIWKKKLKYLNQDSNYFIKLINYLILYTDDNEFENNHLNLKNIINKIDFDKNKINIMSFQGYLNPIRLTNSMASIEYNSLIEDKRYQNINFSLKKPYVEFFSISTKIKRIQKVFNSNTLGFDPQFVIFVRNQLDLFKSLYTHYEDTITELLGGKSTNFKKMIISVNNSENKIIKKFFDSFNYDDIYETCSFHFKDKYFKFFIYEDFVKDNKQFIEEYVNYLGLDVNESLSLLLGKSANTIKKNKFGGYNKDYKIIFLIKHTLKKIKIIDYLYKKIVSTNVRENFNLLISRDIISYNNYTKKIMKDYFRISNRAFAKKINSQLNDSYR